MSLIGIQKTVESKLEISLDTYEEFSCYKDLPEGLDLFFTFGGDGTILSALTIVQDRDIPIVGVNTGRLGFLATINLEYLFESLDSILSGDYNLSRRSLIAIKSDEVELDFPFALNEVSVTRRDHEYDYGGCVCQWRIFKFILGGWIDSFYAYGFNGLFVELWWSIVHPENKTFILTPIAGHNLNVRPFIISDDSILELKIKSRVGEYFLSLDARNKPLPCNVRLQISKADFHLNIVEPKEKTYLMTLRDKMFWGSDKRN